MLSLIALVLSLVIFFGMKSIDWRGGRVSSPYVRRLWSSLHESRRAYLFTNLSCILLIAVSAALAIQDSSNELVRSVPLGFQVLSWLFIIASLVLFSDSRFMRHIESPGEYVAAYVESIEGMSPEAGIDYIVSYMQDPKWGCAPYELRLVLFTLSTRDDALGAAARAKMKELGLESPPE